MVYGKDSSIGQWNRAMRHGFKFYQFLLALGSYVHYLTLYFFLYSQVKCILQFV